MWSEKLSDMHRNPLNCILHIVAAIVVAYGLWNHDLETILFGALIAVVGHIIEEVKKKKKVKTKKKVRRKSKKAALEMSIGTIVIMVIAITMLILGIVFVRSIMCKGILMTDKLNEGVMNEIGNLFGSGEYGVKCMGENGEDVTFGTGGKRAVGCLIRVDKASEYKFTLKKIESNDVDEDEIKEWIDFEGWEGSVNPGGNGKQIVVLMLDIPRESPSTSLRITLESTLGSGSPETHTSYINIEPTNFATKAMC